jgi:8-oxo-dGTP diphosphatase
VRAASDARNAAWFVVDDVPELAFDHAEILAVAYSRLRAKVRYQPIGFELLPRKFTLRQMQGLYEKILDRPLDKRNFRKKVLGMGILAELDEIETDVAHRAARLYRFDKAAYDRLVKKGFNFEI